MSLIPLVQWVGAFGIAALMIAVSVLWQTLFPQSVQTLDLRVLLVRFLSFFLLLCMISLLMLFLPEFRISLPGFVVLMVVFTAAAVAVFESQPPASPRAQLSRYAFIALFLFGGTYLLAYWPW